MRLKDSFFEKLFKNTKLLSLRLFLLIPVALVDQEVLYIISNKDIFRFKDLETTNNSNSLLVKLNDFSIYLGESGFKLTYRSQFNYMNVTNWKTNGILLIKYYPAVVDFNYILRFENFRFLNNQARNLYIGVNKAFLKQISDYPTSTSNDLGFDYGISKDNWSERKMVAQRSSNF